MRKQYINLLFLLLLSIRINLISIASQLTNKVVHFDNISEAYLTIEAQKIYILHKNLDNGKGEIVQYAIAKGNLTAERWLPSQSHYSDYWQIYDSETEIVSFPIKVSGITEIYNTLTSLSTATTQDHIIFRGIWVRSRQAAFLSTVSGEVGYAASSQTQNGKMTLMLNSHHIGNTFLSLSPNQRFLCSSDILTGLVSIWDVSTKKLFKQIWLNENGIATHSWSADSTLLYVFGCKSGIVYQISANNNFDIIGNFSTSITYIFSSFFNYETSELIAIASNRSELLVINISKGSINYIPLNFAPVKLRQDRSKRYFAIFSNNDLQLYKIDQFCGDPQYYNLTSRTCNDCKAGCKTCDPYTCFSCQDNYILNQNGTACIVKPSSAVPLTEFTQNLAKATLLPINQTINVPGHRQFLSVFFQLFSNFDHFLLYIYHGRNFGPNMQIILQQIHDTIDYRFQIISQDICANYLGVDFKSMQNIIDYKADYSFPRYSQIEENGEGYFESNIQYYFLNLPLILLMLIFSRIFLKMVSNCRFSVLFKKFNFWGIIVLLLLQGNIQFFFFSFTSDFLLLFQANFNQKLFNLATILAAFTFLLLSTLGLASLYLIYRKKSSQLYENCSGNCASALYFVVINGVWNILRGIIHRSAISVLDLQAFLLFIVEFTEAFLMIIWWKRIKIFKSSFVTLLFLSGSISRALFNLTLLSSSSIPMDLLDHSHIAIFILNVFTFFLSIVHNCYEIIAKLTKIYSNKIRNMSENQTVKPRSSVFNRCQPEQSEAESVQSSELKSEVAPRYRFKRKESSRPITFKFCRKNVVVLTIKERPNKMIQSGHQGEELQSVDL